jgi:hypothetical protein
MVEQTYLPNKSKGSPLSTFTILKLTNIACFTARSGGVQQQKNKKLPQRPARLSEICTQGPKHGVAGLDADLVSKLSRELLRHKAHVHTADLTFALPFLPQGPFAPSLFPPLSVRAFLASPRRGTDVSLRLMGRQHRSPCLRHQSWALRPSAPTFSTRARGR